MPNYFLTMRRTYISCSVRKGNTVSGKFLLAPKDLDVRSREAICTINGGGIERLRGLTSPARKLKY